MRLLQELLDELLDAGDCLHYVAVCEVLRARYDGSTLLSVALSRHPLALTRHEEVYLCFWELLHRLDLPLLACQLSAVSSTTSLEEASKRGTEIKNSCNKCMREVSMSHITV